MLEPSGGLRRARLHRAAGVRRPRRLRRLRPCDPRRARSARRDPVRRRHRRSDGDPHRVHPVPPRRGLLRHRHVGRRGGLPPPVRAVEDAWRRHRYLAPVRRGARHRRHRHRHDPVRRALLPCARHPLLLDRAGAGRRCHRRDLRIPAHPQRPRPVGRARQPGRCRKPRRRHAPHQVRCLRVRRGGRRTYRRADLLPEGLDHPAKRVLGDRLDGVRPLHRRDRRDRHAGRPHHRRPHPVRPAELAGGLRHLVPHGAGRACHPRHAGRAEGDLGLHRRAHRFLALSHPPQAARAGHAGAGLHQARARNAPAALRPASAGRMSPSRFQPCSISKPTS